MATQTLLVDDFDGTEAAETIRFGLDGKDYEIDLSAENAQWVRETMAAVIEKARRLPRYKTATAGSAPAPRSHASAPGREDRMAIRAWARENGWPDLGSMGVIAKKIQEAYVAAHSS